MTGSPTRPHAKPDARPTRSARTRRPWVRPEIQDFGSARRLVRGATGHRGDPGAGGVGKRP